MKTSKRTSAITAVFIVVLGGGFVAAPPAAADSWHNDAIPYVIHYAGGKGRARIGEGTLSWTDYGARVTAGFWLKDFSTDGYCGAAFIDEYGHEPIQTHVRKNCNGVDTWYTVSMPSTSQRVCNVHIRVGRINSAGYVPESPTWVGGWYNRDGC